MASKKENQEVVVETGGETIGQEVVVDDAANQTFSLPAARDRMLEKVKIILRNQGDESVGHEFIGINDFMMNIKREEAVEVPRYVYEHIKNTKGLKIVREGNSMREIPFNRFIVELVED